MFTISLPIGKSLRRFTDSLKWSGERWEERSVIFESECPREPLHRLEVGPLHHQVRSKSVSEVMEMEIFNPGPLTGASKPFFDVR